MPCIRKLLEISTAHLARGDSVYLDSCADPATPEGLPVYKTEYGWFAYATDDPDAYSDADLPPHVRLCA